jgi:hypothetical protein
VDSICRVLPLSLAINSTLRRAMLSRESTTATQQPPTLRLSRAVPELPVGPHLRQAPPRAQLFLTVSMEPSPVCQLLEDFCKCCCNHRDEGVSLSITLDLICHVLFGFLLLKHHTNDIDHSEPLSGCVPPSL